MSPNLKMETVSGGVGKSLKRMVTNEGAFINKYTAENGKGEIAFAATMPGAIVALNIAPGQEYICQKGAYLASTPGVEVDLHRNKAMSSLFGGEGIFMQKLSGSGIAFLEINGSMKEFDLQPGQSIVCNTGYLGFMSSTCSMNVEKVKGVKNVMLGGEGLFNTVITGPGHVALQSMPISLLNPPTTAG